MALSFRTPLSFKDHGREVGIVVIFIAFACMGMPLVIPTNTIEKNIENIIRILNSRNNNGNFCMLSALCIVCIHSVTVFIILTFTWYGIFVDLTLRQPNGLIVNIKKRIRTNPSIIAYGLYLYFNSRSYTFAGKSLEPVIKRTHV